MPRFYFHLSEGTGFVEDEEGRELADSGAARALAVHETRDLMAGEIRSGVLDLSSFIEVQDEARKPLFTIRFDEAVQFKNGRR